MDYTAASIWLRHCYWWMRVSGIHRASVPVECLLIIKWWMSVRISFFNLAVLTSCAMRKAVQNVLIERTLITTVWVKLHHGAGRASCPHWKSVSSNKMPLEFRCNPSWFLKRAVYFVTPHFPASSRGRDLCFFIDSVWCAAGYISSALITSWTCFPSVSSKDFQLHTTRKHYSWDQKGKVNPLFYGNLCWLFSGFK